MKTIKYILGLITAILFLSSCDEHVYEDASWHAWRPGMVYCTNGEVMSYPMRTAPSKAILQKLSFFMWITKE